MLEMFKYYKGESENPFPPDSLDALFWFYESKFKEFYEAGQFDDTPVDRTFADYLYEIFNERIPEKFGIKPEVLNSKYFTN